MVIKGISIAPGKTCLDINRSPIDLQFDIKREGAYGKFMARKKPSYLVDWWTQERTQNVVSVVPIMTLMQA
jgi:hypothetical protein